MTLFCFVTIIVHAVEAAEVAARDGNPIFFTDSCSRESPAKENQVFESLTQSVQLYRRFRPLAGQPSDSFVRSQLMGLIAGSHELNQEIRAAAQGFHRANPAFSSILLRIADAQQSRAVRSLSSAVSQLAVAGRSQWTS